MVLVNCFKVFYFVCLVYSFHLKNEQGHSDVHKVPHGFDPLKLFFPTGKSWKYSLNGLEFFSDEASIGMKIARSL